MPPILPPSPQTPHDPSPEPEPPPEPTEHDREIGWRYLVLQQAGWDEPDAKTIAFRHDIDLHTACDLLRKGCDPTVALDILL